MRRALTLMEVIVVIVIIGIMAALGIATFNKRIKSQREKNAAKTLPIILAAEDDFYNLRGKYTQSWQGLDISDPSDDFYRYNLFTAVTKPHICIEAEPLKEGYKRYCIEEDKDVAGEGSCGSCVYPE